MRLVTLNKAKLNKPVQGYILKLRYVLQPNLFSYKLLDVTVLLADMKLFEKFIKIQLYI